MRGRKPSPASAPDLTVVQGVFGDSGVISEPEWAMGMPADWSAQTAQIAAEQWALVTSAMRVAGTLAAENAAQIEVYCINYARWKLAEAAVAKLGPIVKAPKTGVLMHNPYLAVANKAAEIVTKIAADLGLPPSMRGRVTKARRAEKTTRASDRYLKPTG